MFKANNASERNAASMVGHLILMVQLVIFGGANSEMVQIVLPIELTFMTEQLNKQGLLNSCFKYYTDGKARINADKQELLLLEVSFALDNSKM